MRSCRGDDLGMLKDVSHISLDTNIVHWVHTTGVMRVGIRQTGVRRSVTVVGRYGTVRMASWLPGKQNTIGSQQCSVGFEYLLDKVKYAGV